MRWAVGQVKWYTVKSGLPAPNDWVRKQFVVTDITTDESGRCVITWQEYTRQPIKPECNATKTIFWLNRKSADDLPDALSLIYKNQPEIFLQVVTTVMVNYRQTIETLDNVVMSQFAKDK